MANQEYVKLLKQGFTVWNAWRKKHPEFRPDLRSSDLSRAHLNGADLRDADLSLANLCFADLSGADLSLANLSDAHLVGARLRLARLGGAHISGADLSDANLRNAHLSGAHLTGAHLGGADLSGTNLSGVDLRDANLSGAHLSGTNLSGANLSGVGFHATRLSSTIFARVDLCAVEGLDMVIHEGPSSVDVNTVKLPEGDTRTLFLQGAGFSDIFIEYLPSLFTAAIQYASCFLSYAHQDESLAQRLYKDLQDKGVRCWMASHDLRPGDYHHSRIDEAIHLNEKVLLLLSQDAVTSSWVKHEVQIALAKEIAHDHIVLFPLRLDEAVLRAKDDWAARLRESRHIGEFSGWQDDAIYQQRFAELLCHLKIKTT